MRHLAPLAVAAVFLAGLLSLTSCGEPDQQIHVTQTRELTLHDRQYPGNIRDIPPVTWRRLPPTQFRTMNYLTGKDESVEIVMGDSRGDTLQNANRWLGQFGLTPLQSVQFLGETSMLGRLAYIVEADGQYVPGMGKPTQENYSLVGVIRPVGENIITLKMTGPKEEVAALREEFFRYLQSLETDDSQFIPVKKNADSETEEPAKKPTGQTINATQ